MSRAQGRAAEQTAFDHLIRNGLRPIARNWTCRMGELDLVMEEAETVVVVEVRQRRNRRFATPAESVTTTKQQRLIRTTRLFLLHHPHLDNRPVRFDLVALGGGGEPLEWIRDAFQASD